MKFPTGGIARDHPAFWVLIWCDSRADGIVRMKETAAFRFVVRPFAGVFHLQRGVLFYLPGNTLGPTFRKMIGRNAREENDYDKHKNR